MQYRCRGEQDWHAGTSENLSCTGILFRAQQPLASDTPVAIRLALPSQLTGGAPLEIVCDGYIVRGEADSDRGYGLAAAILSCRPRYPENRREAAYRRLLAGEPATGSDVLKFVHELSSQLAVIVGNADIILGQNEIPEPLAIRANEIKRAGLAAAAALQQELKRRLEPQ